MAEAGRAGAMAGRGGCRKPLPLLLAVASIVSRTSASTLQVDSASALTAALADHSVERIELAQGTYNYSSTLSYSRAVVLAAQGPVLIQVIGDKVTMLEMAGGATIVNHAGGTVTLLGPPPAPLPPSSPSPLPPNPPATPSGAGPFTVRWFPRASSVDGDIVDQSPNQLYLDGTGDFWYSSLWTVEDDPTHGLVNVRGGPPNPPPIKSTSGLGPIQPGTGDWIVHGYIHVSSFHTTLFRFGGISWILAADGNLKLELTRSNMSPSNFFTIDSQESNDIALNTWTYVAVENYEGIISIYAGSTRVALNTWQTGEVRDGGTIAIGSTSRAPPVGKYLLQYCGGALHQGAATITPPVL